MRNEPFVCPFSVPLEQTPRCHEEVEHASNVALYLDTGKHPVQAQVIPLWLGQQLETELIDLRAQLARCRRDSGRLDLLEKMARDGYEMNSVIQIWADSAGNIRFYTGKHGESYKPTLRDAIDAAHGRDAGGPGEQ